MRRNFAQILEDNKIDIKKEYKRLYTLFYEEQKKDSFDFLSEGVSVYKEYDKVFPQMSNRGTAISLEDFDAEHGFNFSLSPKNFNIDYLVLFCEYVYNLTLEYLHICPISTTVDGDNILQQVNKVIEKIGYKQIQKGKYIIFVEKSIAAVSVAEMVPEELSYQVISYNHYSMKGDIIAKKDILLKLANNLEPKRKELKTINASLEKNLFYAFNNLNLRHNNCDKNGKNYKKYLASMLEIELEKWYDEVYQMCLLAFLELDDVDREKKFTKLIELIESN